MNGFEIKEITSKETYPLRKKVLWPNKSLSNQAIETDADSQHFGLFIDGNLISIISYYSISNTARFRKFATHPDYQNLGYGSRLLSFIIDFSIESNITLLWCDARVSAKKYYSKFGFETTSDVFYKSELPYIKMSLTIDYKHLK